MWIHSLHDQTVQFCDLLIKYPESLQLQREHLPMRY